MDLKRLQFLVRVIDIGSFTRAAVALRIAQPALSQHIQALERSVGARLLHRGKDGVTPTEAGLVAYRNAKLLARQLDRARLEVRSLAATPSGRVTVGLAPHGHGRTLIQPLLRAVSERYPDLLLHLNENFEGLLAEDLRMGRMDMALLYEIAPQPAFCSQALSTEPLRLVGQRSLLRSASSVLSAEVPLLLPSAVHAIRRLVEAVYLCNRVRPRIVAEIESFETLAAAVAEGLGATVLPDTVARSLAASPDLVVRRFGTPPTSIGLSLVTAGPDALSEAAQVVHDLLLDLLEGEVPLSPGTGEPRTRRRTPAGPALAAPRRR